MTGGSHERAAQVAARAFLGTPGVTYLQAKIGAHVASFGGQCWQTDNVVREALRRSDGRQYHRESIGRARRILARRGLIGSKRIFPSQRLPTGWRSSQGTTNKHIVWKALGVRDPVTRGEKREAKLEHAASDRRELEYTPRRRLSVDVPPWLGELVARVPVEPKCTCPTDRTTPNHEHECPLLRPWLRSDKRGPPE